ncbi:MAG TPA: cation transporter [Methanoculleus sp.]|nr:cation transporter [Methanoculleus sp.]
MHAHVAGRSEANIRTAFILNLLFTIVEVAGGIYTGSLAITADALHDLGDSFSLGLAWFFERIAQKKPSSLFSYGYRRFSLLAALINALVLIGGSILILSLAVPGLFSPGTPDAPGMFLLSLLGITANGAAAYRMRGGKTLNEQLVVWHLLEDVLGWAAVLVVSIVLLFRDIAWLDPALSILITLFVLWNVIRNSRRTLLIFLQGVPPSLSIDAVEEALVALLGVCEVHDTHIWSLDGEHHILTAHVVIDADTPADAVREIRCRVKQRAAEMGISHATIEIEEQGEVCVRPEDF